MSDGEQRTLSREEVTKLAEYDLTKLLYDLRQKHRLSFAEMYYLLAQQLHLEASQCVRAERREAGED